MKKIYQFNESIQLTILHEKISQTVKWKKEKTKSKMKRKKEEKLGLSYFIQIVTSVKIEFTLQLYDTHTLIICKFHIIFLLFNRFIALFTLQIDFWAKSCYKIIELDINTHTNHCV